MTDPMENVKKLAARFSEEIEKLGMHVHTFAVLPNLGDGPHMIQAALIFDGDELDEKVGKTDLDHVDLSPEEQKAFDDLMRDTKRADEDEKAREAAEGLEKLMKSLEKPDDGILGND